MSHPDGLPGLFLDRSLGRNKVPALLRAEGLRLTTLAEHYGDPEDEDVTDEEWLALAGENRWVVKDARVRYNRAERETVREHLRCFCLSNRNLTGDEMTQRFIANLQSACRSGPLGRATGDVPAGRAAGLEFGVAFESDGGW